MANVPDFDIFLEGIKRAGFNIKPENWQYQRRGVIVTLPDRDWGYAFFNTANGLSIQGSVLFAEKAQKHNDETDSRLSGPIPSPDVARRVIIETFEPSTSNNLAQTGASTARVPDFGETPSGGSDRRDEGDAATTPKREPSQAIQ